LTEKKKKDFELMVMDTKTETIYGAKRGALGMISHLKPNTSKPKQRKLFVATCRKRRVKFLNWTGYCAYYSGGTLTLWDVFMLKMLCFFFSSC
jgi:hypothetical protein